MNKISQFSFIGWIEKFPALYYNPYIIFKGNQWAIELTNKRYLVYHSCEKEINKKILQRSGWILENKNDYKHIFCLECKTELYENYLEEAYKIKLFLENCYGKWKQ